MSRSTYSSRRGRYRAGPWAVAHKPRPMPRVVRLGRAANRAAWRTGQMLAGGLLDHYSITLMDIRERGFAAYWAEQFRPYMRAAAGQFSPRHRSLTDKWLR